MNFIKTPLYLGKDMSSDTYFFLASKGGVGRFIKYVKYPLWCGTKNLVDFLDFKAAPEFIINEVNLFINGKVEFEIIPKSRGKPEKVIRLEIPQSTIKEINGDSNVATSPNLNELAGNTPICNSSKRTSKKKQQVGIREETFSIPRSDVVFPKKTDINNEKESGFRVPETVISYSGSGDIRESKLESDASRTTSIPQSKYPEGTGHKHSGGCRGVLDGKGDASRGPLSISESITKVIVQEIKPKRKRRTKAQMEEDRKSELCK